MVVRVYRGLDCGSDHLLVKPMFNYKAKASYRNGELQHKQIQPRLCKVPVSDPTN